VTVFTALVTVHVCLVVMAFGPLFVYPMLIRSTDPTDPVARRAVVSAMVTARRRISEPAFVAVGPLGLLAALNHPDEDVFHRLWVQLAIPLWIIAVSVVWFIQRPLSKRVAVAAQEMVSEPGPETSARFARLAGWLTRVTWISWAGLVVMVWLMLTQPA
jgi:Predicted integral membrane protein (DUF2269)